LKKFKEKSKKQTHHFTERRYINSCTLTGNSEIWSCSYNPIFNSRKVFSIFCIYISCFAGCFRFFAYINCKQFIYGFPPRPKTFFLLYTSFIFNRQNLPAELFSPWPFSKFSNHLQATIPSKDKINLQPLCIGKRSRLRR